MQRALAISLLSLAPVMAPMTAAASGLFDVTYDYDVTIAGIDIGDASLSLENTGESYAAGLSGDFRFLFWSGGADARSSGTDAPDQLTPASYRSRFESPSRVFTTMIDFDEDRATNADWRTDPPLDPDDFGERVPIEPAHLIGAKDPLSAFIIRAESGEAACARSLKVYSGVVRFDVDLFVRGVADGLVECGARYRPVSGHRVESEEVDRLREDGLVFSYFEAAPGVWAPHRVGFRTRFGTVALERRVAAAD